MGNGEQFKTRYFLSPKIDLHQIEVNCLFSKRRSRNYSNEFSKNIKMNQIFFHFQFHQNPNFNITISCKDYRLLENPSTQEIDFHVQTIRFDRYRESWRCILSYLRYATFLLVPLSHYAFNLYVRMLETKNRNGNERTFLLLTKVDLFNAVYLCEKKLLRK